MNLRLERTHIKVQLQICFWSLMPWQHKTIHLACSLDLFLIHTVILDILKLLLKLLISFDQSPQISLLYIIYIPWVHLLRNIALRVRKEEISLCFVHLVPKRVILIIQLKQ